LNSLIGYALMPLPLVGMRGSRKVVRQGRKD